MNDRVKVLLLAAGLGTRLRPMTDRTPKCLIPVSGRPLLSYWFDRFGAAGIREVLVNTHAHREQVLRYMDQVNQAGPFKVKEAYEPKLLGSAGTVHANRNWADDAELCLIVYADNLSTVPLEHMLDFHRSHGDSMTMMLFRAPEPERCGIVQLDDESRIVHFEEKPEHPRSNLANGGLYVMAPEAFRKAADMNRFDLAFDVLPSLIGEMRGWVWDGYHRDIGTPESLKQAEEEIPDVISKGQR